MGEFRCWKCGVFYGTSDERDKCACAPVAPRTPEPTPENATTLPNDYTPVSTSGPPSQAERERSDAPNELESLRAELTRERARADEAREQAEYWLLVADGVKHDDRCVSHFAGDPKRGPCLRCQLEEAQRAIAHLEAQLEDESV